jgi:hypothetical protein
LIEVAAFSALADVENDARGRAAIAAGVLAGALVADISQVEEHRLTPLGACRLVNIVHPPDSTVGPNTAHYHGQNAWNSRMARTRISV